MPRWLKLLQATIVTGLTFAVGVGVLTAIIGTPLWLFGAVTLRSFLFTVARFSVMSCLIGMAFSGLLALTARGRSIDKLSLPHFAALGAGVGFLFFLFMGMSGAFHVWSLSSAIANLLLVTVTGGGSAVAMLLLARRGRPSLNSGEGVRNLKGGRE